MGDRAIPFRTGRVGRSLSASACCFLLDTGGLCGALTPIDGLVFRDGSGKL